MPMSLGLLVILTIGSLVAAALALAYALARH
jgi:hypothetical protein